MAKVGVIGAGSWGIALAKLLRTNGNEVTVPDSGGTVCIYKKHRKKHGRICDRRTDHCLRGKGN